MEDHQTPHVLKLWKGSIQAQANGNKLLPWTRVEEP